jgi:hypothetical protein
MHLATQTLKIAQACSRQAAANYTPAACAPQIVAIRERQEFVYVL